MTSSWRIECLKFLMMSMAGVTVGVFIFQYSSVRTSLSDCCFSFLRNARNPISIRGTVDVHTQYRGTILGTLRKNGTTNAAVTEKRPTTKKTATTTTLQKTTSVFGRAPFVGTSTRPTEKYPPELFPKGPPVPYKDAVVPKIVHYTWFSLDKNDKRNTFRFHHFISILSAYTHIKPTRIMFWHNSVPAGIWWTRIQKKVPIIEMKYRKAPAEIHGRPVRESAHVSDIVRLEAVMEFGGIYTDLDVVVLASFDPLLKYNTTMGYESGAGVANGLCNGVIISRPRAKFLEIWYYEYRSFTDSQWAVHSVILPAKLAKKYPSLIHTEAKSLHRPNWLETKWLYKDGALYDWSKNYAVHIWYRFHDVDHNPEDIKTLNTTMGQIFRYIYYGISDLIL